MARNQALVVCPPGVWTKLTDNDTTDITFQVQTGAIKVRAAVGATPPATLATPGYVYVAREADPQAPSGELRILLSDLAEAAGVNQLYATPVNGRPAKVLVDHA
jgi:hypothetical protein